MIKRFVILISLLISIAGISVEAQPAEDLYNAYGYFYCGNFSESVTAFNNLIGNSSVKRPSDFLYRGICNYNLELYQEALQDFSVAAESNIYEACLWQARAYIRLRKNNQAIDCIRKFLTISGETEFGKIQNDTVFRELHNLEAWHELWQNQNTSSVQEIIAEADYLAGKQQFEEAHLLLESSIEKDDIRVVLCNSKIYEKEGNIQLAVNELNRGLKINPDEPELMYHKALYMVTLKKYNEAYTILTELLTSAPEDFPLRLNRAEAAYKAGDLEVAKEDIELYLKYFNNEDARFLAGKIEYASGRYLNALRYFNSLLENNTSSAEYFRARGLTYYQTHTFQQAAYDLSMSLDLEPDDMEANYYLGLTQHSLGNNKMACYYMNRAVKYGELKAIEFLQENCRE